VDEAKAPGPGTGVTVVGMWRPERPGSGSARYPSVRGRLLASTTVAAMTGGSAIARSAAAAGEHRGDAERSRSQPPRSSSAGVGSAHGEGVHPRDELTGERDDGGQDLLPGEVV
jgi:hypothetical protein